MKREFKYTEIKEAYLEIKEFLQQSSGAKINSLDTKIMNDLGIWGDETYLLLVEFVTKYNVNFDEFNYDKHFESEYQGCLETIIGLTKLPFAILNELIVKFISSSTYQIFNNVLYDTASSKKDLTFADLILCKLSGEFCLREDCKVVLAI